MRLTFHTPAGEARHEVGSAPVVIGRDPDATIRLDDPSVSRRHAIVERSAGGQATVRDLGSVNGTWVNDERVAAPRALAAGDRLRVGRQELRVEASAPPAVAVTAPVAAAASAPPAANAATSPAPQHDAAAARGGALLGRVRQLTIVTTAALVIAVVAVGVAIASLADGEDEPPATRELIAEARPSIVQVLDEEGGELRGMGSGWVLDARKGLVVTNSHVMEVVDPVAVALASDDRRRPATLVGASSCDDLAVLRVEDTAGMRTMPLGDQAKVQSGDEVVALGYPASLSDTDELVATTGVVSVPRTSSGSYRNAVRIDAAINGGNSGGPLLTLDGGRLLGVNTFGGIQTQNENYAIGVDRVKELAPELAAGTFAGWLGLGLDWPVNEEPIYQDRESGRSFFGPAIVAVTEPELTRQGITGSGVDRRQFVVGIEGRPFGLRGGELFPTRETWCEIVRDRSEGDSVTLTILQAAASDNPDRPFDLGLREVRVPFR